MEILIETIRSSSRTNKDQRGDKFRKYEKKGKKSIPRMGWFRSSGPVEILNVRWPFITWLYKYGQVDWWIKLQNCIRLKRNTTIKFFVDITLKKESFWFIINILIPTMSSHIHLFRSSNINQTWFRTCQEKWR